MNRKDIEIRILGIADLHPDVLEKFNRYQVTNRVKYKQKDQYFYKEEHFVEYWDEQKKKQVIQYLQKCISKGGFVAGAFINNLLIGFANIENKKFGEENKYVELPYIHVSHEYRNLGIGKELFHMCCEKARELGASKVYIAAHPAEETQNFYKSVNCVSALEVNKEIYDNEPLDIQLEFEL